MSYIVESYFCDEARYDEAETQYQHFLDHCADNDLDPEEEDFDDWLVELLDY